jgi:hypothetical protein
MTLQLLRMRPDWQPARHSFADNQQLTRPHFSDKRSRVSQHRVIAQFASHVRAPFPERRSAAAPSPASSRQCFLHRVGHRVTLGYVPICREQVSGKL